MEPFSGVLIRENYWMSLVAGVKQWLFVAQTGLFWGSSARVLLECTKD